MEASKSRHKIRASKGFTLVEMLVAIFILTVGLLSIAALMAMMSSNTERSRYMSLATFLASEKLEDLNAYSTNDPSIYAVSGTPAGSITSDITSNVTLNGTTTSVDYFDNIYLSAGNGSIVETLNGKDASGTTTYITFTHTPAGLVTTTTTTTAPTLTADMILFKRRWIIEKDLPVAGVRRITVVTSSVNPNARANIRFQTSMVRP